jgi:N6-adenosine-specific RNA methylase IME4
MDLFDKWPFGPLQPHSYDLIMIDPPWPVQMRSPKGEAKSSVSKYGSMTFEEIERLPIGKLASRNAVVWMWATWPLIFYGGDPRRHFRDHDAAVTPIGKLLKAWGSRYVTGGAWFKRTVTGKAAFGTGYRFRSACEPYFIGIWGAPFTTRKERNVVEGLAREHSRKPEEAFALCERWMPGARRVELFSRQSRPGWDTWGYEAGKFDPVVTEQALPLTQNVIPFPGRAA